MANNTDQMGMGLLTVEQVANDLNLSIATIRRFIKSKRLKAVRIGKSYRINKSDYFSLVHNDSESGDGALETLRIPVNALSDPKYPKGRSNHLQIFPGISSEVLEAVAEMSKDLPEIGELRQIIALHAKDCLELLNKIEAEGIKDPQTVINLLLVDEAIKNLTIRRNLFKNLLGKTGIILLPLPPHLSDSFLTLACHDLIFITDEDVPPHLKHEHYRNLVFLDPEIIDQDLKNIQSVITEGYLEDNNIYVRRESASLIYQLCKRDLRYVYIHNIPHIPPRSNFVELNTGGKQVEITYI